MATKQLTVRIPEELMHQLKVTAALRKTSVQALVLMALQKVPLTTPKPEVK